MKIDGVFKETRINESGHKEITFIVDNFRQMELLKQLNKDKYTIDIKKYRDSRSLEQNKLLWHNIQLISQHQGEDAMDTYCNILEMADAKSDFIISTLDIDDLRKNFRGVRFWRYQEINGKEFSIYKVYIGSSKMNTKEMTTLIDKTLDIMYELGIEDKL